MDNIPCSTQEQCRLKNSKLGCRVDIHHLFYPARDYAKGVDKEFRELDENKVVMCRALHEDIHYLEDAPDKPTRTEMLQALGRIPLEEAS